MKQNYFNQTKILFLLFALLFSKSIVLANNISINPLLFHDYGGNEQLTFNNSRIDTTVPIFRLSNSFENFVELSIEINSSPYFNGFSWTQNFEGNFLQGEEYNFHFTNAFTPNNETTYFVRAKAKNENNVWSNWTTLDFSFTYQEEKIVPDWYQNRTLNSSFNQNFTTYAVESDENDVIINGSFEDGLNGWEVYKFDNSENYQAQITQNWKTDGAKSLKLFNGSTPLEYTKDEGLMVVQNVDLTGVNDLNFDIRYVGNGQRPVEFRVYIGDANNKNKISTEPVYVFAPSNNGNNNGSTITIDLSNKNLEGEYALQLVYYVKENNHQSHHQRIFYIDNIKTQGQPVVKIISKPIHFESVQGAISYDNLSWTQTLGEGEFRLKIQKSEDAENNWTDIDEFDVISYNNDGQVTVDLSEIEAYPHLRLVGTLIGDNVQLKDWSVKFVTNECSKVSTWDGSKWSNGIPSYYETKIIFAGHYTSGGNNYSATSKALKGCSIEVKEGINVVISSDHNVSIQNEIIVPENSSFTISENANLIQINESAENSGKIKVLKDFTFSAERNQFNFVISPVQNQNIKNLFETNDYLAQKYNETTNYFEFFDGQYLDAGIGQAIEENKEGDEIQTAVFVGEPHNGTINVTDLSNEKTRFHLAGNPYPSQLDLVQFYTDNSANIESTFLFWDNRGNQVIYQQGDDYQGSNYAVFNADNGTGTAAPAFGEINGKIPTQKVAVGNAFMLRLLETPAENSYTFNNAQRVNGKGENFLGNAPTLNIQNRNTQSTEGNPSSTVDRYWLTLNTPNGATVMNAVVYFDGGNDDFAKDDSKITGGSDDIYTLVDEHQLKIQGKSSFDVNDKIKLGYKAFAPGIHTISIYDKEGVFADGQKIFIRDLKNDIVHELTASDFTFKTFAGEFNDRFEIFYKRSIKASENKATLSNVIIYQNENHIQIAAENQLLSDVEIYDLNGISVYQATDINLENWQVPNHLFGKGILVVVVKTADGEVVNKKIINN